MIKNGTPAPELGGVDWRKSSFSNSKGNCAELAGVGGGQVAIRQNTDLAGPALVFDRGDLAAFAAGVKAGQFDDLLV